MLLDRDTYRGRPCCLFSASYLVSGSVIYLVITDRSYPRKLAFAYLDELAKEFDKLYGSKVDSTQRPYAFVGFGKSGNRCKMSSRAAHWT